MIVSLLLVTVAILCIAVTILSVSNAKLWIEVKAMKGSTHQIVMPSAMADDMFSKQDEQTKESMSSSFEDYVGIN